MKLVSNFYQGTIKFVNNEVRYEIHYSYYKGRGTEGRVPTATELRGPEFVRGALSTAMLETADEGARGVSVTRQDDVLRVHVASVERGSGERPVVITQRIALPRGARLTVEPVASP